MLLNKPLDQFKTLQSDYTIRMTSIDQKLQTVFPEFFQVKRVKKEIEQIIQGKQKYFYEPRMSFSRGQSVTFMIDFHNKAFKKFKRLQNQKNFEVKIILKKQYPANPPLIYCMSNSMINLSLQPFRDYSEFLTVDWSAKFTIMEIIKVLPEFLDGWIGEERKGKYRLNELFEIDRIFSWSFLQTFPVKFVHPNKVTIGLLVISCQSEIILLEQVQGSTSYVSKDLIKISELVSIFKSRKSTTEILLQVKNQESRLSLIFRSDDSENIVNYVLDYMKLASSFGNEKEEVSSEEEENDLDEVVSKESPTKFNIEAIKQEIVLYESLVENKMTSQNVSNLVVLLKKAIEFYSAIDSSEFQIYLKKMKAIMNNEMAQVLLESTKDAQTAKSAKNSGKQNSKVAFQSIIDLI